MIFYSDTIKKMEIHLANLGIKFDLRISGIRKIRTVVILVEFLWRNIITNVHSYRHASSPRINTNIKVVGFANLFKGF